MQVITLHTHINAAIGICFDLSLNIDVHMASTAHTSERAVAAVLQAS
jgi:hypothetical protein